MLSGFILAARLSFLALFIKKSGLGETRLYNHMRIITKNHRCWECLKEIGFRGYYSELCKECNKKEIEKNQEIINSAEERNKPVWK